MPASLSYPQNELRERILVYKLDLGYPKRELKKMVLKEPRMQRTDSTNIHCLIKVLHEELDIGKEDIHTLLCKEALLLTYNAEDNIRPTIQFLKNNEIGLCLGMVKRKGLSTFSATSQRECDKIIKLRLKMLIMGHPKILSSSLERNLKPTVKFFMEDLNLTKYEFGRMIYRRGGSLLEANLDRTLKRKVGFLRSELGLEVDTSAEGKSNDFDLSNSVAIKLQAPLLERQIDNENENEKKILFLLKRKNY